MFLSKLIVLASKMFEGPYKKQILAFIREAASTTYYRAIPIRASQNAETYSDKVASVKAQAIASVEDIFQKGYIDSSKHYPFNAEVFNLTRHWETAVYYATYQTERRLATNEPLLPLIVHGTIEEDNFILDPDELSDPSLKWPTLEQLQTRTYDPDWFAFLTRNFGIDTTKEMLTVYVSALSAGMDPTAAKKEAAEKILRGNPEAAKSTLHSVDPSFKDQFHVPIAKQETLPVESVLLIQNDGSIIQLTPENYRDIIEGWVPYTEQELREIKTKQDFSGVQEGYYPFATR